MIFAQHKTYAMQPTTKNTNTNNKYDGPTCFISITKHDIHIQTTTPLSSLSYLVCLLYSIQLMHLLLTLLNKKWQTSEEAAVKTCISNWNESLKIIFVRILTLIVTSVELSSELGSVDSRVLISSKSSVLVK